MKGKLFVIGFGPGSFEHITKRARDAIQESEIVIGYTTYVELISGLLTDQKVVSTGMTEEVSRAREAVRQAEMGKKVAVISSGDAGVYGMAGLIYEVLVEQGWIEAEGVAVEVIPGISAINSCAALLGAPVMHDACTISLSDHLTPWELIAKRIDAAGQADFVIALYNPKSGRRTRQIVEAQQILLKYRSPDTPVGIVKSAYREREHVVMTTLEKMLDHDIGMLTTVIIGNESTFVYDGKMITPRGYQRKYTLTADEQPLKPHERLRKENEPWALGDRSDDGPSTEDRSGENRMIDVHSTEEHSSISRTVHDRSNDERTSAVDLHVGSRTPYDWAAEALMTLQQAHGSAVATSTVAPISPSTPAFRQQSIFECAVSPGVVNKKWTPQQMVLLAEVAGDKGEIEYTPHHQMILRIPTEDPSAITAQLREAGLLLMPVGDVVQIKACDFCDGEKKDAIPYAEELNRLMGGLQAPKELKLGVNGCGMACYGAVKEDIGIVYRKGAFDLFLGAKSVGRNAHPGVPVAEGIPSEEIVPLLERIVTRYREEAFPNERFHKFFKRVGEIEGFAYRDMTAVKIEDAVCGT
ncbi:precorrin-3B C(17)-methyltransferase [Brevibacillus humidisoli]|uniref:precorrin-3B C(17)-methyltransferase n=1 Tax=Brevibacillus humidisoli TaxID=2895522 RepID=UPI001E604D27|nr:precorrin-3B C(17)-methyltransferase [Brevibacillus humidisoli]UFJ41472.1 precorrin-3B C(17)-methyltransferase [Brevibacillus humidisoli]